VILSLGKFIRGEKIKLKETWCKGMRGGELAQKREHGVLLANMDHIAYSRA
jgi:hypothetical protein